MTGQKILSKDELFNGAFLFALKDTHGFPLDFALDRVMNDCGRVVDWVSFIEAARKGGWWDFQTHDLMLHAMQDAGVEKSTVEAVMQRFRLYVLRFPHPRLERV